MVNQRKKQQLQSNLRGNQGEQLAQKYLQSNGYKIIETNWHIKWAEIDIVGLDGDTLAIVEVKTRYSHDRGSPEEAITPHKLHSLERSALLYKQVHEGLPDAMRIDFIGIDYAVSNPPRINLIKNISV